MKNFETIKNDMNKMVNFFTVNKASHKNIFNYFGENNVFHIESHKVNENTLRQYDINYSLLTMTITTKNDTIDSIMGIEVWTDKEVEMSEKETIKNYLKDTFNANIIQWIVF